MASNTNIIDLREEPIVPSEHLNEIIHGDCLEVMRRIPDKSVDLVINLTAKNPHACVWDESRFSCF